MLIGAVTARNAMAAADRSTALFDEMPVGTFILGRQRGTRCDGRDGGTAAAPADADATVAVGISSSSSRLVSSVIKSPKMDTLSSAVVETADRKTNCDRPIAFANASLSVVNPMEVHPLCLPDRDRATLSDTGNQYK